MAFLLVQCKHALSDGGLIRSLVLKTLSEETVATESAQHFINLIRVIKVLQLSILCAHLNKSAIHE